MASIRFQFDEHIPRIVALTLRQRGIDAITAREAGMLGIPDDRVLTHAHAHSRVMVTFDRDYLRLNASGVPHSGIIFFGTPKRDRGSLIEALVVVHGVLSAEDLIGNVEYM